jgi:hypothetical protein
MLVAALIGWHAMRQCWREREWEWLVIFGLLVLGLLALAAIALSGQLT